jgi:hypothetical protein
MKKLILLLCIFIPFTVVAQLGNTDKLKKSFEVEDKDTSAWLHGGVISLGMNEGFLHNWPAGGEIGSIMINGLFSGFVTHLSGNTVWTNNLDLNYGLFYAYSNHFVPFKTDDRIDFTSKYGFKLHPGKKLYLTSLFNFKSQFTKGYDYTVPDWQTFSSSKFLSPAYFTLALGLEYRRADNISLFISPVAARLTLVDAIYTTRAPEGAFGVEYGKSSRFELGAYFSGRYSTDPAKKVFFKTRLDLYSNYLAKDKKDSTGGVIRKDSPGNIDILWDNLLSVALAKYLSINLGASFIYDNDIPYKDTYVNEKGVTVQKDEPGKSLGWWQLKQIFTLGFKYKF